MTAAGRSTVRERLTLRRSPIHGRGVFARVHIPAGERIIEYRGERITPDQGDERYPWEEGVPYHTFLFELDEETVVDGGVRGNMSRWINHSCEPNCDATIEDRRIFINAARDIEPGEELTYDYHFILKEPHTAAAKRRFPCICGTPSCRGTMLGKKR